MLKRITSLGWLREMNLVGGRWVAADGGGSRPVDDPATGEPCRSHRCRRGQERQSAAGLSTVMLLAFD